MGTPLTALDPRWITNGVGRHGMGLSFDCPHCPGKERLAVWFLNPIDDKPPAPGNVKPTPRWLRKGETFESLTLAPSINVAGHWHGYIADGEIR